MARTRMIKPAFFQNEVLVEMDYSTRLLFIGLWVIVDKRGRSEDRPKKVKMTLFPADNIDIDKAMNELHEAGLIRRYKVGEKPYFQVVNFEKHQRPHRQEPESIIPPEGSNTEWTPNDPRVNPPLTLNLDTLTLNRSFDLFWEKYPRKVKKKLAQEKFLSLAPDEDLTRRILQDIQLRLDSGEWQTTEQGINFIPHPPVYLNQRRWEDELPQTKTAQEFVI